MERTLAVTVLMVTLTLGQQLFLTPPMYQDSSLCFRCSCPRDKAMNPFGINCRSLNLDSIPAWDQFMLPSTTNVDNVHIDFSFNQIKSIPIIQASRAIDALVLDQNGIETIPAFTFANLTHLKFLSLKNNMIERLHVYALQTPDGHSLAIEILDLRNNAIHHLDDDSFQNLDHLIVLRLGGNPFGHLDGSTVIALNGLHSVTTLDLSNAALTDLPFSLINPIRRLEELDLSKNAMKRVPEVLQRGDKIIRLNLDGNSMEELDAASFVGLRNLEKLNISYMPYLKSIYPGTFQLLKRLQVLYCGHNPRLESIQSMSFTDHQGNGPSSMNLVYLRQNNLSTLNHELFKDIQVTSLDVQENPIHCSCRITWLKKRYETDKLVSELRCVQPITLSGKLLKDADIETTNCSEDEEDTHIVSFLRLRNVVYETYIGIALIMTSGFLLTVFITVYVFRSSPRLHYRVMRRINPVKAQYAKAYDTDSCDVYTLT